MTHPTSNRINQRSLARHLPGYRHVFHQHHSILLQESKHRDRQPSNPNRAHSSSKPWTSSRLVTIITTITRIARPILIPIGVLRNRRDLHVVDRRVHASADECFGVGQGKQHHTELTLGLPQNGDVGLGAGSAACPVDTLAGVGLFYGGGVATLFAEACGDLCFFFRKVSAWAEGGCLFRWMMGVPFVYYSGLT
jgi:hypothetical protein